MIQITSKNAATLLADHFNSKDPLHCQTYGVNAVISLGVAWKVLSKKKHAIEFQLFG
jgi:hypothetical protein